LFCQCNENDLHDDLQTGQVVCLFQTLAPKERLIDYYRLPKGQRNQNFLVCTEQGKFLMRIRDSVLDHGDIAVEKAVFSSLNEDIRHPEHLCSYENQDVECTLYDYVEGKELSELLPTLSPRKAKDLFNSLGRQLATIHGTKSFETSGFLGEDLEVKAPLPPLREWLTLFRTEQLMERLGDELWTRLNYQVLRRRKQLELMEKDICLVHGDCNGDNIVIEQGRLTFLDWEFVAAGHRYADIGQLFRGVSGSEGIRNAFFGGYNKILPQVLNEDWWMMSNLRDLFSIVQLLSKKETCGGHLAMLESYFIQTLNQIDI
jgi:aminoglycoside phosphotransferase (APT) family kinase protein